MGVHEGVEKYYNGDAPSYQASRWFRNEVAQTDYLMTKEALTEALGPSSGESILEIGCGPGTWTGLVAERCANLIALDISKQMISLAKEKVTAPNVIFIQEDFLEYRTNSLFDKILSVRTFEYFSDKKEAINKMHTLLREEGTVIIVTKSIPSIWNGRVRMLRFLRRLLGRKSLREHDKYFWMERIPAWKIKSLLRDRGFSHIWVSPVILRLPIFGRGEDEYPIIFPPLEGLLLSFSLSLARWVRDGPAWLRNLGLLVSESYLIKATKVGG